MAEDQQQQPQGNIIPENNSATTGMNLDRTIGQISKGMLTYALNAAVENFDGSAISYQNESGNEFCLDFPDGYQMIGHHFIAEKNKHIFFLANPSSGDSEIGYMDNNDCIYHTLVNAQCLNFNIHYPIHKAAHKLSNCTTEIYWTDGYNVRRYLDIDNIPYKETAGSNPCNPTYTNELDCNQIKIQPNFSIPEITATKVVNGGELISGTYQFAIQYASPLGSPYTSYYSITNPVPIANTQLTTPNFNYNVGKSIEVNITNIDISGYFTYFNLAVIKTVNSIPSVELVGTYFIDAPSRTITYTGAINTNIRLTVDDIFEKYPYYDIAQDLTTVQDILVWDNLTSIDRINYQQIASKIILNWETWRIPNTESYANETNAANFRGYLRDEVYAFEIVFLLRNGKQTDGFHIPGRVINSNDEVAISTENADFIGEPTYKIGTIGYSPKWKIYNTGSVTGFSPGYSTATDYKGAYQYGEFSYWESTERYSCNKELWGDLADQPIRHHKFPDVEISPIYESALFSSPSAMVMQKDAIFPIGVRIDIAQVKTLIDSSSLTQEQKDAIVGFKIIRGDRAANRSIIAKGMIRNVASYEREGNTYYFANYPYNDLRKDPFLFNNSNAYSASTLANTGANVMCRSFTIYPAADGEVTYIDCNTLSTKTIPVYSGKSVDICCLDFPKPALVSTQPGYTGHAGYIICNTYSVYKLTAGKAAPLSGIVSTTFSFLTPVGQDSNCWWDINTGEPVSPPVGYSPLGQWCSLNYSNACCQDSVTQIDITIISSDSAYVWSLNPPSYKSGSDKDYRIEKVKDVYGGCEPTPLDTYKTDAAKYRMVFNSPETSFGNPFLGQVLKIENVMFGAGYSHFTQVKKNAMYKLISKEAQTDAFNSAVSVANITHPSDPLALFATYQAYITIYLNGITRRNYAYSFNSIASYDYSNIVGNEIYGNDGYLGIKQRELDVAQYLFPVVENVGDDHIINNFYRESSVYLKTKSDTKTILKKYVTYRICNTNLVSGSQTFQYTSTTTNTLVTVNLAPTVCVSIDSFTAPVQISGNSSWTITQLGQSSIPMTVSNPPLPFAEQTPSIAPSGVSTIVDNSRFVLGERLARPNQLGLPSFPDCSTPEQNLQVNVVSYYASLKDIIVNQWGQIYSYPTLDTGFQKMLPSATTPVYETVFGGDTFIGKFAYKTKLPFFSDWRVNAPDDSDIFYDEIGNVAYPKYWHSARSVMFNATAIFWSGPAVLTNFLSIKAHNFDCPNSQTGENNPGRMFYDGKFYLFAYGIPYFYCESNVNVDLRQAFNDREGDFWPHVSTSIPDNWLQEYWVSIANDNTYYYNPTYSKQNRENYFSHLPDDWSNICYTNYPFRAIYSEQQDTNPENRTNSWLSYMPISYYDLPRNFGNLISLDGIQNKGILARFENKSMLYNTMLTVSTSNPKAAYMGNDTFFRSSPPVDFAETDLGYVGTQNKFLLKIPQGQITVDAKRGQVFLISGNQAIDISAFGSGMNRFLTDHLQFEILRYFPDVDIDNHFNGIGLHGVYDAKYDRVIITKLDYIPQLGKRIEYDATTREFYAVTEPIPGEPIRQLIYLQDGEYFCNKSWTLSYNVNTRSWISFHSYIPNFYIAENNFFYSGMNDCCTTPDLITAVVGNPTKLSPSTTTTTSSTTTSSTSTTSTTTTKFTGCDLDGTAVLLGCDLDGTAIELSTTTTTTTCICAYGQISDDGTYYFTDCQGNYLTGNMASGAFICYNATLPYSSENILPLVDPPPCSCGFPPTTTTSSTSTTTTSTTCYCTNTSFVIYQTDLDAAVGNTNPSLNGKVFFNYTNCYGVPQQISFDTAGTFANSLCSCNIDGIGFYYTGNVHYLAFSNSITGDKCTLIT